MRSLPSCPTNKFCDHVSRDRVQDAGGAGLVGVKRADTQPEFKTAALPKSLAAEPGASPSTRPGSANDRPPVAVHCAPLLRWAGMLSLNGQSRPAA